MLYPEISSRELIEKLDSDDFIRALVLQRLHENPVSVTDTEDGYSLSMESEVYDFLNRNTLKDFGITLEKLTSYFFEWIAACPEEFKIWIEESVMEKGAENDNK